ncbi:hypothetical protein [Deefgea rivuli]|uniref:hypothetical protein n=1 Tax=Deefgea rivuli TaxID=400948 RepID=UPI0004884E04|nr:hypothetical protein [Deefgea rivuli]
MFAILRALFVLAVLGIAYSGVRYVRSRDVYWLKVIRWILYFVISLSLLIFTGLLIQRLLIT